VFWEKRQQTIENKGREGGREEKRAKRRQEGQETTRGPRDDKRWQVLDRKRVARKSTAQGTLSLEHRNHKGYTPGVSARCKRKGVAEKGICK
jgi:hypothetical protein